MEEAFLDEEPRTQASHCRVEVAFEEEEPFQVLAHQQGAAALSSLVVDQPLASGHTAQAEAQGMHQEDETQTEGAFAAGHVASAEEDLDTLPAAFDRVE